MKVSEHISRDNDYYKQDIENVSKYFLKESKRPNYVQGATES